jgi:hypothetical protein
MKNTVFWDVARVGLVRTDVTEERIASIIRVKRIGELGTTLALTTYGTTLNTTRRYVPPKRRFLQELHYLTSQKMAFFIAILGLASHNAHEHIAFCHNSGQAMRLNGQLHNAAQ